MTGAAIIRQEAGGAVILAVLGAFDGASAWALRIEMDESSARRFVVDLSKADEACEFAAGVLAAWARQRWREKHVTFLPGSWEHARILVAHGLELEDERWTRESRELDVEEAAGAPA